MKSEYLKKIEKLEEYNKYREGEVYKHLDKLLEELKKNISQCGRYNSAVGFCEQFLHDVKWYEQQNAICGEVRKTLVELEIDFEKKDKIRTKERRQAK